MSSGLGWRYKLRLRAKNVAIKLACEVPYDTGSWSPGINGVKFCILAISWQQNWPFRNYNLVEIKFRGDLELDIYGVDVCSLYMFSVESYYRML
jgi:hypothetical protein